MDHLQNVMGYFDQQQPLCAEHDRIAKDLYREFGVKAGLRDENGKGVLAGLTNISDIRAFQYVNGVKKPADGQLLYRGYDVKDLIRGSSGSRFAFEEAAYLLLFGELPTQEKLEEFCRVLGECRTMPTNFTRDVIMKAPSHDIMNSMARSVLTLASYDPMANDLDISNVLVAATDVLIPVQAEEFALGGLTDMLELIDIIRQGANSRLRVVGLLPTMVGINGVCDSVVAALREHYPELTMQTQISRGVVASRSTQQKKPIIGTNTKLALQYTAAAQELLARLEG